MALKTFKPVTPSSRELVLVDRSELWKGGPLKKLVEGKSRMGGRNAHGHITVRHKGGGHKKLYRSSISSGASSMSTASSSGWNTIRTVRHGLP